MSKRKNSKTLTPVKPITGNVRNNNSSHFSSLKDATGKIPYNMLNDYMFRIVLQDNIEALRNIIASVLHIPPSTITDVEVRNTIVPGETPKDKEYRMDIRVVINNSTDVDIELQIRDEGNWEFRGLHYLCREFDKNMKQGDLYSKDHTSFQIGFLDYTLFEDNDKFFSAYEMCDIDTHYRFNSNFSLFVINLNRIDIATEDDINSGLARWCRFFKASTYDELKDIVKEEKLMESLANDILIRNADENIQKLCEDRDDYLRHEYYRNKKTKELTKALKETKIELDKANSVIDKANSERDKALQENEQLKALLQATEMELKELKSK